MEDFRIFIVEDDEFYAKLLKHYLSLNPDYIVEVYNSGKEAISNLYKKPAAVTLDYNMPDMKGSEVIKRIKKFDPEIPIIIVSGQEDVRTAINLLKEGAYDYIVKDDDTKTRLWNSVKNIAENKRLKQENEDLKEEIGKKYEIKHAIKGNSPAIRKVFNLIEKACRTNITVSISGETGTGKDLVAKAIHYNSPRSKKPFVPINVAAIPRELIESELFGHEKGAFTGANTRRIGKFEEADGGTIFLDEIGEMDLNMQTKLLRVLQEKELSRVGGNTTVNINVRVIVATHRNLENEVQEGNFRQDLYYRLLGLHVDVPPLRDRGNDIFMLARHFLDDFCLENKMKKYKISSEAQKKLMEYPYPGNVRELKSIIELSAVMANTDVIDEEALNLNASSSMDNLLSQELTLKEYTSRIVKMFLDKYDQDVYLVAQKLDIGKSTIYRMLQKSEMTV